MPQNAPPDYVVHRTFDDFDQMCDEVRQWNLDFRQLDRGRFSAEVLQFGLGSVHISDATFERCLLQAGAPPEGLQTIAIPANAHVRFKWRGCEVGGSDLMIFPRGAELDSISDETFNVYTCSFPEELLASICEESEIAGLNQHQSGRGVVRCSPKSISRIQSLLKRAAKTARTNPEALHNQFSQQEILRDLPRMILRGVEESRGVSRPTITSKRATAVQQAVCFIERFAHQSITISDLASELKVSPRTLEYAFRESLGVTPKAYLMSYRLNKVRRQLRASKANQIKIADIANHWGFWHMGQFARDYQEFFSELPSETLKI